MTSITAQRTEFSEHLEIHTLELPKLDEAPPDAEDEAVLRWGRFFAAERDEELEQLAMNDPDIARAKEALETLSQDPTARALARQRRLAELDYQSGLQDAKAEGEARGEARGEAKSLQAAIRQLCRLFGIELDSTREERLSRSTVQELFELHDAVASHRSWPES